MQNQLPTTNQLDHDDARLHFTKANIVIDSGRDGFVYIAAIWEETYCCERFCGHLVETYRNLTKHCWE